MDSIDLTITLDHQTVTAAKRLIVRDLQAIERQVGQLDRAFGRLPNRLKAVAKETRAGRVETFSDLARLASRPVAMAQVASASFRAPQITPGPRSAQITPVVAPAVPIATAALVKIAADVLETATKDAIDLGKLSVVSEIPISELDRVQLTAQLTRVEPDVFQEIVRSLATDLALLEAGRDSPLKGVVPRGGPDFGSEDNPVVRTDEALRQVITQFNELDSVSQQLVLLNDVFGQGLGAKAFSFFQRFAEAEERLKRSNLFGERSGENFLDER